MTKKIIIAILLLLFFLGGVLLTRKYYEWQEIKVKEQSQVLLEKMTSLSRRLTQKKRFFSK